MFRNINKSYCFNGKFDALNIASIRFVRAYANSNQEIIYSINKPTTITMEFAMMPNVSTIAEEMKHLAFGFNPVRVHDVDNMLPSPSVSSIYKGPLGKYYKAGRGGVKIYKAKTSDVVNNLSDYVDNMPTDDLANFAGAFYPGEDVKMIVKLTPIRTYRDLMTCYKEAMMTYRVYSTERNGVRGTDLVCKPYVYAPFHNGKKWYFVFITTRAVGTTLDKRYRAFGLMFTGLSEQDVYNDLNKACHNMWTLGFVHNDMKPDNVVYDVKTRKVTFIDFETAVEMPCDVTSKYIEARETSNTDAYATFEMVMLKTSMELLLCSEDLLNSYSWDTDAGKVIYNTDCGFLWQLKP